MRDPWNRNRSGRPAYANDTREEDQALEDSLGPQDDPEEKTDANESLILKFTSPTETPEMSASARSIASSIGSLT
jgi:hypothetical protein